ncbi:hypothetical protein [Asticcacaulis sp.]|uniref:hypothetical protein n=1 Tax=Asticcacaulis sp. TaxID=1872648 RepID=UPI0031E44902
MGDAALDTAAADNTESAAVTEQVAGNTLATMGEEAPATEQAADTSDEGATGEEGAASEEAAKDDKPETKAPEAYEDFALPEGVEIDAEVDADLKTLAKELDLTQEQAQLVANLGAKQAQKWVEAHQSQIETASKAWADEVKADPEFGGDNLKATLASSAKALNQFGTPELRKLLDETRLGNHPEFVRTFAKIGRAISEDTFVSGDRNSRSSNTDAAKSFYPNSKHN